MFVSPVQVAKDLDSIRRKVEALVKKGHHRTLEDFDMTGMNTFMIQVSSPEQLGDHLADIVRKSDRFTLVSQKEYPGSYDWASGVYVKDCSTVEFKL